MDERTTLTDDEILSSGPGEYRAELGDDADMDDSDSTDSDTGDSDADDTDV